MGTFCRVPLWILLVILGPLTAQEYGLGDYNVDETIDYTVDETLQGQQQQQHQKRPAILVTGPPRVSVIPVASHTVVKAVNAAHNNRVCSTWGNFNFKNFDGDIFYFPGTCNYIFASNCKSTYEDFSIQIRRSVVDKLPVIERITMKIDGLAVVMNKNTVSVNDKDIQLPFSGSGIQIEKHGVYLIMTSKLGMVFMWNDDDSLLLELDEKYANQTCGLCGDYNGISIHNEFISNGIQITESQFGNLQKLDGPTEQCADVPPVPKSNCTDHENICESILLGTAFSSCHSLVAVEQYIDACVKDLCRCDSKNLATCLCDTFAEYSRQCAHAGGEPENWRTKDLCPKTCPFNMQYQECGSPCADSCSNPERSVLCENHCLEGCFCPPGTVFDDMNNSGCVPLDKCSCTFNSNNYAAGTSFSTHCSSCACIGGKWKCENFACPATCSIDGGSHITTYDQSHYDVHGDCNYVLTKDCKGSSFIILTELRKCGLTESETCLKSATLILNGETIVVIKPCGSVFVNNIYTRLPMSAANVTVFRPSNFYIVVETNLGVQLVAQLIPFMQVYVVLDPSYKGQTCGLCGNFNDKQTDEFLTINGVIEGTAASFANTWKTQASCANIKNVYEDPCSLSIENEKYAQHWCGLLSDPSGPFAACHATVDPAVYKANCMFDTCNCEKSEECMCASLSSYVLACATKGIIMEGWRTNVCFKYMNNCPKTQVYTYSTSTCQPTCRSLSEPDVTCGIKFPAVDGCTCAKNFYLDDSGKCVSAETCPCYFKGSVVPSGETIHENGIMCTCTKGQLSCIGTITPTCTAPMVYLDCKNVSKGTKGSECQKSCHTLDMACYSAKCISGCVCPAGLVSDGKGGCIKEEQCPCIHNDATYQPGEKITMKCNTCTCKDRMWQCTKNPCLATCAVYGDGHYITFDGKRYNFDGDCEYILAQDHCSKGGNGSTFRVVTENIPCGTTGTTCSKSIKVFMGSYELILTEEHIEVLERGIGEVAPYKVRHMGIYLVIEADNGLILMWDKRTSLFIKLSKDFEGKVCGLCGDYDGNGNNDFTTRSLSVVEDVFEFGNSWKVSPTCPDAKEPKDSCRANPYRKSWAQKQCSILNSKVFSACHAQVDVSKYYDACVEDACACDSGGDCECFCTAVAAYAQACGETGVCVSWRTPSICPLFCDYYNPQGVCEWHYKPCGAPCMKTCRNPSGKCMHELSGLEGCYPSCPAATPFFDEDDMECVAQCGCYDDEGKHYKVGQPVPTSDNCKTCNCKMSGIECKYQKEACQCEYHGKMYHFNDVIYNTTDGIGGCISAICKENGTIYRDIYNCKTTTTPRTTFSFTSTHPTTKETKPPLTTICVKEVCKWSQWFDASYPEPGMQNGDFDTYDKILAKGYSICKHPQDIQCRAERFPDTPLAELEQNVQCNVSFGLICQNSQQLPPICYNYELRVLCCGYEKCDTTPATTPETTKPPATTQPSTTHPTTKPSTTTHPTTKPSTSIVTTAPTTHVSTTTSNTPTACQPKCTWTEWLDVHLPGVGKDEGDYETYDKIIAEGHRICKKPDGIQCRSEKYPKVPIGKIGQVVQCNLTFGLVCKNEDQEGDFKVCLNYQIKVLCCDDYSHCGTPVPATTTETTTPLTTTPVPPTTTETTTPLTTTPVPPTTTETTTPLTTTPVPPTTTETTTPLTTTPVPPTTTETTTPVPPTTTETTTPLTTTPVPPTTTETTTPVPPTTTETTTPVPPTTTETTTPLTTTPVPPTTTETTTPVPPTTTETTTPLTTTPVPPTTTETTTPVPPTTTETTTPVPPTTTETTTPLTTTPVPPTTTETTTPLTTTPVPPTTTETTTPLTTTPVPPTTTETTTPLTTTPVPPTTTETTTPLTTTPVPPTTTETTTSTTTETTTTSTTTTTVPPTTTETTTTTTTTETPTTTETTTTSTTTPETTTTTTTETPETTTPETVVTRTFTTPKPTTSKQKICEPQCKWSTWIDVDIPTSDIDGGDKETFENIMANGKHVCQNPQNIECRAADYPGISITSIGQKVQCDVTIGLVCNNKDQVGDIKQCYNYQIKVLCCDDYSHCSTAPPPTTTPATTTTTTVPPTTTETTTETTTTTTTTVPPTTTPTTTETTTTTTTTVPPTTTETTTPTTTETTTTTTTTPVTTTTTTTPETTTPATTTTTPDREGCQPKCKWTTWIDVDTPTSGIDGGDKETFENIIAKDKHICKHPKNIECRAEDFPDITIDNIGQVVTCDLTKGLVCNNKDQTGVIKLCYNYQIKVLCCDDYSHCSTAPPQTTTPATTTTTPTTTTTETTTTTTTTPVTTTTTTTTPETTTTTTTTPETTTTTTTPETTTPETTTTTTTTPETTTTTTTTPETTTTTTPETTTTTTTPETTTTTTPKPTTTTTTTPETTTTTTTTATTTPETTTTTPETTTTTTTTPETTTPATTTTTPDRGCQPKCKWTTWIDVDTPTSGIDGGDKETFENIIAKDKHICKHPKNIECRAEDFPDITIGNVGQVVTCDLTKGLVCNNKDQTGKVKLCYNYQIKVLCCDDYSHCSTAPPQTTTPATTTTAATTTETTTTTTTTPLTTTTTTTPETTTTTTTPETTTTTTTTTPETTTTTTTTPETTTTTTTPKTTTTTTTTPETTTPATTTTTPDRSCQPKCKWTTWIDVDTPTPGIDGGDKETFENIIAKDKHICKHPKNIECRAEDFPDITIDNVGQVVTCDLTKGLVCNNKDQTGVIKLCYNYQIKVLCCDDYSHCSTAPPQTTTPATTTTTATTTETTTTTTTTPVTTTPETTTTTTTTPETTTTTTPETTTTTTTTPETTTPATTTETTTTTTTTPVTTTPETTTTTTTPETTTTTTTTPETTTTTATTTPETTTTTTTTPETTTTTTTTPETTTPATTTTTPDREGCQPKCKWTTWIDVDTPTSGIDGGDKETFENIIAKDKHICKHPKNIECRAEDFPDITIDNVGQVVTCDLTKGFVCNNKDQTGKVKQCYNYQIKVLCCDDYSHCSTAPPQTTTPATTTTTTAATTTETTTTTTTTPETTTTTPETTTTTTTPETTTPATTTTTPDRGCQPKCKWTTWIDVDTPTSGIDGGDKETFENIIAKDKHICKHPKNIECRAEDFPDITIDNVGQVVTCDLTKGLVCNNKDQTGKVKLCYNYQIKVLCCDDYSHCSTAPPQTTTPATTTTTATTTKTTHTTTTTTTPASTTTTKPTTTTPEPTHTTKCFCHVESKLFSPGEIIYNKTDAAGCIYYAVCNDFCEAERFTGPCRIVTTPVPKTTTPEKTTTTPVPKTTTPEKTTTEPTTTTHETTTTVPATTTPEKTTPLEGCPPHKTKETWKINNCTVATCHGNNVITIEPVSCPKLKPLSCANGFPPVKKMSADGCCEHYECECVCSGWGDPHYITFDGTYYTFLDNCTYVLVQQITPKYDNFRVLVDNYFCDAEDGLSCPQSILIFYKSNEIVLTRMLFQGRMNNRIRFNQEWVTPGFTKDGITVTSAGINMIVEIPEINAFISFSGMIFVIKLPFSKFGHNTEGQCGTCSNNGTEDCRMPDGKIVKDCSKMAYHWKVNDKDKPYCNVPPPTLPPNVPTTPPPKCEPSALCDVILSDVFAECHKVVPPKPYHEGCVFDACRIRNDTVQCSSLEIYATLCTANGVCVDWRNKTKGHCPYNCPAGKVYNACGTMHPKTCENKEVEHLSTGQTEGCYCPKGTTLFNSYTDVCVKSCSCVGPEGMPKGPGETWTSSCKECTCEKNSLTVQCKAMTCPPLVDIPCKKEGFIIETLPDPEQPCCMKNECYCNSTYCVEKEKKCATGFEAVPVLLAGDCCPSYDCRPLRVCVYDEIMYKPGSKIPETKESCSDCVCTDQRNKDTLLLEVQCKPIECKVECGLGTELVTSEGDCCGKCEPVACIVKAKDGTTTIVKPSETYKPEDQPCVKIECHVIEDQYVPVEVRRTCPIEDCPVGSTYKTQPGECCGTCVPVACVIHLSDNTTKLLQPDEQYAPPEDKCSTFSCSKTYDVVKKTETCPAFDRANCLEGTIKSDGCCETCETGLKGCGVHKQSQRIKTSTCESDEVVELSFCGGACMTSSKYSAEAKTMEHKCSCCQEVKTSKRQVNLKCEDGTTTVYTYIYTEECGCTHTECQNEQQTSSSQKHEKVQTEQEVDQEQQSQQTN
ncbi:mucin-5AC-like [Eleutherodactylus coqui]|uniref:mucin-5AC-like n=1 Tax=Eleutherodactylus coqui TaxID=57060 RepID=UPI0034632891